MTANTENLIVRRTRRSLSDVCERLPKACQEHQFGVLGMHDLKEKMNSKGVAFGRECRVFEVCNPQQAKTVLEQSMAVSTALPCRISVYEEQGETVVATIKPTLMLGWFSAPGAAQTAAEVERTMTKIMDACAEA